jgi:hypothetical protein
MFRLNQTLFLVLVIAISVVGCKPSSYTFTSSDDYLAMNSVEVEPSELGDAFGVDKEGTLGVNPALIAEGVNLAVKGVKTLIEKSSERSYDDYQVVALGQQF